MSRKDINDLFKEVEKLGDEVREALGKLPAPSRHKQTIAAWNRITEATELIDKAKGHIQPGGSYHGRARHVQIVGWLDQIRDTLTGAKK